jgi:hypothetical protein
MWIGYKSENDEKGILIEIWQRLLINEVSRFSSDFDHTERILMHRSIFWMQTTIVSRIWLQWVI